MPQSPSAKRRAAAQPGLEPAPALALAQTFPQVNKPL
jgi:hypothetical protein